MSQPAPLHPVNSSSLPPGVGCCLWVAVVAVSLLIDRISHALGVPPCTDQTPDDIDFPPLAPVPRVLEAANTLRSHVHSVRSSQDSTARSTTPKIPPGLSLPHAHPSPSHGQDMPASQTQQKPSPATPGSVAPAVPILPVGQRVPTPNLKSKNEPVVEVKSAK